MSVSSTDGATAAVSGTSSERLPSPTAVATKTRLLQTTWPRTHDPTLLASVFPTLPFPSWSRPVSTSEPARLTSALPAQPTSPPVPPRPLTTGGAPDVMSSSPGPPSRSSPAFPWRLTSAPVPLASGDVVHCQVQLANNYQETLNASHHGTSSR